MLHCNTFSCKIYNALISTGAVKTTVMKKYLEMPKKLLAGRAASCFAAKLAPAYSLANVSDCLSDRAGYMRR